MLNAPMVKFKVLFLIMFFILYSCNRMKKDFNKNTKEIPIKEETNQKYSEQVEKLDRVQYHVTKENGTEPPFKNQYWDNKKEGLYVDIISGEPLFSSTEKFDSGTGWPSYTRPVNEKNIELKKDYTHGMVRIEVRSQKSDAHLGHVFEDGPPEKGGLRYCINSAALRFIPRENLEKEGYKDYLFLFDKSGSSSASSNKKTNSRNEELTVFSGFRSKLNEKDHYRIATFGAGCFWGVEAILKSTPGVLDTEAGYMGGLLDNPGYQDVSTGRTGHAEVVQVLYDEKKIEYEELLRVFFRLHDPTTLNRQGPDTGSQYRSVIFFHTQKQRKSAEEIKKDFNITSVFSASIKRKAVTEITEAKIFYAAEDYHQDYFDHHSGHVCHSLRKIW